MANDWGALLADEPASATQNDWGSLLGDAPANTQNDWGSLLGDEATSPQVSENPSAAQSVYENMRAHHAKLRSQLGRDPTSYEIYRYNLTGSTDDPTLGEYIREIPDTLPVRAIQSAGANLTSNVGNIALTVGNEAIQGYGAITGQDLTDNPVSRARSAINGAMQEYAQQQADLDKQGMLGETLTGALREAGGMIGEMMILPHAKAAQGAGALKALATRAAPLVSYMTAASTARSLADSDARGETGFTKYAGAAVNGTIDGAFAAAMVAFGSGLGKLASDSGGVTQRVTQYLAEKYSLSTPVAKLLAATGEGGSQVAFNAATNVSHYLTDVAFGRQEYKPEKLLEALGHGSLTAGIAGAVGGALQPIYREVADTIASRVRDLPTVAKAIGDAQKATPEVRQVITRQRSRAPRNSEEAEIDRLLAGLDAYAERQGAPPVNFEPIPQRRQPKPAVEETLPPEPVQETGAPEVSAPVETAPPVPQGDLGAVPETMSRREFGRITGNRNTSAVYREAYVAALEQAGDDGASATKEPLTDVEVPDWRPPDEAQQQANREIEQYSQQESEAGPQQDFGPSDIPSFVSEHFEPSDKVVRATRGELTKDERTEVNRKIGALKRKANRGTVPKSHVEYLGSLDPRDQHEILYEAKSRANLHNEWLMEVISEYKTWVSKAMAAKTRGVNRHGGNQTKVKNIDADSQEFAESAPNLYAYASSEGRGDPTQGLYELMVDGVKGLESRLHTADDYLDDSIGQHKKYVKRVAEEEQAYNDRLAAEAEPAPDRATPPAGGTAQGSRSPEPLRAPQSEAQAEQVEPFALSRESAPPPPAKFESTPTKQPDLIPDMWRDSQPGQQGLFEDGSLGAATPGEIEGKTGTSLKNAVADWERQTHGLSQAPPTEHREMQKAWSNALAVSADDPTAGPKLAQALIDNPQLGLNDADMALLLKHKNDLLAAKNDAARRTHTEKTPEGKAAAEADFEARTDELRQLLDAIKESGSHWGREGRWRQAIAFEDYSLESMQSNMRRAHGRELTPTENAELKAAHERIAELEAKLEKRRKKVNKQLQEVEAGESVKRQKKTHDKTKGEAKADADAGKANLTPAEILDSISPESQPIEIANAVKELYKHFLRKGMTDRDAILFNVNNEIRKALPDFSPVDTVDAFTDYGKFTPLNKDPIEVKFREQRAEELQIRKLLAMDEGQELKATGRERQAPTDEHRRLTKFVNELKKKYNLVTVSAEGRLKSALDALKTRRQNRIKDLQKEIAERKRMVKEKQATPEDAKSLELQKELEKLKAEHKQIFGTPEHAPISDAQRLRIATAAAERDLAEFNRRIPERDFSKKPGRAPVEDANLFATRLLRDSAKATWEALRALDPAFQKSANEIANKRLRAKIVEDLARYGDLLKRQDFNRKPRPESKVVRDAETTRLQDKLDVLHKEFQDGLHNAMMGRRLTENIDKMKKQLSTGNFPDAEPRKNRPLTPENRRLKTQHDILKKERDRKRADLDRGIVRKLWDASGIMRLAQTTGEFSFIFRQGNKTFWNAVGGAEMGDLKPAKEYGKAIRSAFKAFGSEAYAAARDEALFKSPRLAEYQDAKIRLIHEGEHISGTEEAKISPWLDKSLKYKGVELNAFKRFNRAARVFFNEMRTSAYDGATLPYGDSLTIEQKRAIGHLVNVATGYGSLGKMEGPAADYLGQALYSARNTAANFQYMLGSGILHGNSKGVRGAIAQHYARTFLGMATVMTLAKMAGADVDLDPRSADFAKLRFGNTRVDILGGLSQVTTLAGRLLLGETKSTSTGKISKLRDGLRPASMFRSAEDDKKIKGSGSNAVYTIANFARNKLAPNPGVIVDILMGKDATGEDVTLASELAKVAPITYGDIVAAMQDQGVPKGVALGIAAFFGVGLQTYDDKKKKKH